MGAKGTRARDVLEQSQRGQWSFCPPKPLFRVFSLFLSTNRDVNTYTHTHIHDHTDLSMDHMDQTFKIRYENVSDFEMQLMLRTLFLVVI